MDTENIEDYLSRIIQKCMSLKSIVSNIELKIVFGEGILVDVFVTPFKPCEFITIQSEVLNG